VIRAILTDIEGTTTSLAFVKDVLFPYARRHLAVFVHTRAADPRVRALLEETAALAGQPLNDPAAVARLLEWSDADVKAPPLKALQGLIWEAGYAEGAFTGHVYPDAARRLRAWHAAGLALYVFSSGSVRAQELLFAHSDAGDLTGLFGGHFDTRVGPKGEAASYRAIAGRIGLPPAEILFLSDVGAELDAAGAAGMATCQLVRPGTEPVPGHPHAADFDAVPLGGGGASLAG
jgi:enolase-phosphatase E1